MSFEFINPESLGRPRGYANGVLVPAGGRLLFIAGQVAWDERQQIVSADFVAQFDRALANVLAVVAAAGGTPQHVARLVIYVTDNGWIQDPQKNAFAPRSKGATRRHSRQVRRQSRNLIKLLLAGGRIRH